MRKFPFKNLYFSSSLIPFLSRTSRPFSSSSTPMDPTSPIPIISTLSSPFQNPNPNPNPNPGGIDASSSIRKPLSLWPGMYHSPVTNALWEARSSIFERLLDGSKGDGPPQAALLMRTPLQSRSSILYNFSKDYILREQFRDPWNEVRIKKLLEDLDALARTIAVKIFRSQDYSAIIYCLKQVMDDLKGQSCRNCGNT